MFGARSIRVAPRTSHSCWIALACVYGPFNWVRCMRFASPRPRYAHAARFFPFVLSLLCARARFASHESLRATLPPLGPFLRHHRFRCTLLILPRVRTPPVAPAWLGASGLPPHALCFLLVLARTCAFTLPASAANVASMFSSFQQTPPTPFCIMSRSTTPQAKDINRFHFSSTGRRHAAMFLGSGRHSPSRTPSFPR